MGCLAFELLEGHGKSKLFHFGYVSEFGGLQDGGVRIVKVFVYLVVTWNKIPSKASLRSTVYEG